MNDLTGAHRSNAPPRPPYPRPPAVRAGHALSALLLAILTLLGAGPAAAGAMLPVPGAAAKVTAGSPLPGSGPTAAAALPEPGAFAAPAPQNVPLNATAADPAASHGPGPTEGTVRGHATDRISGSGATDLSVPGRLTEALPQHGPRAGVERPPAPHHLPPPGHGVLPPPPPGRAGPKGAGPGPAGDGPSVSGRNSAALPGVRGPPGVTAGQPVAHQPCSTDLASRPARPL